MDIRIKTAEEFSSNYVTIEIRATPNEVVKVLSDPPAYDPEAAAEVLAENYDRARRKVTQLEADLTRIRAAVLGTELARELADYRKASAAMLLVEALTEVRRVIGATDSSVSNRLSSRLYTAEEVGDLQASEAELVAGPLRRRVAELEYDLERYRRAHVCTVECKPNAHTAFQGRALVAELETELANERQEIERLERTLAESRELVEFKTRVADDIDEDREKLHEKAKAERDRAEQNKAWAERAEANGVKLSAALVRAEKDRDSARRRVDELEKQLDSYQRAERRAMAEHIRSLAARDNLLSVATHRISIVRELLAAPGVTKARDEIVTSKGAVLANAIGNALAALDS